MNIFNTFILLPCLLGISLVVPITLPAGGAQKLNIEYRENSISSPLIALKEFNLLSSASYNSTVLTRVQSGTPVNVLKVWDGKNNGKWLLVNVISQYSYQLFYKRGWVNISNS
tara:strand:+ start:32 stop:370 length:339 start_codon:yes stop_codon:yes gene_type:complete